MSKFWVTMGQVHVHSLSGHTIDKDCAVEIEAESYEQAYEQAIKLFGTKFAFVYDAPPDARYIPRGIFKP